MDKRVISHYGWMIVVSLVIGVMIAISTPFGMYVSDALINITGSYENVRQENFNDEKIDELEQIASDKLNSGYGCPHNITKTINAKSATCKETGYSGDKVCIDCNEVVTTGEIIDTIGKHSSELIIKNKKEATCSTMGYTGDQACSLCGEILLSGDDIPTSEHVMSENVVNKTEPTCYSIGYTGDKICIWCNTILQKGENVDMVDHNVPFVATNYHASGDSCLCTYCEDYIIPTGVVYNSAVSGNLVAGQKFPDDWSNCVSYQYNGYTYTIEPYNGEPALKVELNTSEKTKTKVNMFLSSLDTYEVKNIDYLYADCQNLNDISNIKLPESVESADYLFECCYSLVSTDGLVLNNGLKYATSMFAGCSSLVDVDELILPDSITNLNGAFFGVPSTTFPQMPANLVSAYGTFNLSSIMEIPDFSNCNQLEDLSFAFYLAPLENAETFVIPNTVTDMTATFCGCTNLTTTPVIPNSVTIMDDTFGACRNLSVAPIIPDSVLSMRYTFSDCTNLTGTVEINANPTSYDSCFTGVTKQIKITGDSLIKTKCELTLTSPTTSTYPYYTVYYDNMIPVNGYYDKTLRMAECTTCGTGHPSSAIGSTCLSDIYNREYGTCGKIVAKGTILVNDENPYDLTKLTGRYPMPTDVQKYDIYFDGLEYIYTYNSFMSLIDGPEETPFDVLYTDKPFIAKHGRDYNGWNARAYTRHNIEYSPVNRMVAGLPVTAMRECYRNCGSMNSYGGVPDTVITIQDAFQGCQSITSVKQGELPSSILNMAGAYDNCTALVSLSGLPGNVKDMRSSFRGCISLSSITCSIPESCTSLLSAFKGCYSISSNIVINAQTLNDYKAFGSTVSYKGYQDCFNYQTTATTARGTQIQLSGKCPYLLELADSDKYGNRGTYDKVICKYVPVGSTYYVGVTGKTLKNYTGATKTIVGDGVTTLFPTVTTSSSDVFVHRDYEYRVNRSFFTSSNDTCFDAFTTNNAWYKFSDFTTVLNSENSAYGSNLGWSCSVVGWSPRVLSSKASYEPLLLDIGGTKIITINYTYDGTAVKKALPVPSTVTCMLATYNNCYSLTDVSAVSIPSGVTCTRSAFNNCGALTDASAMKFNCTGTFLDLTNAFFKCYKLTKMPNFSGVSASTVLMVDTFRSNTSLVTATAIPSKTKSLKKCFEDCTALKTAPTIPSTATAVYRAFANCSALTGNVTVNSTPTSYDQMFSGTTKSIKIIGSCASATKAKLAATATNGNVKY